MLVSSFFRPEGRYELAVWLMEINIFLGLMELS